MRNFWFPGILVSFTVIHGLAQPRPSIELDSASMLIGDQRSVKLSVVPLGGLIDSVLADDWESNRALEILGYTPWDSSWVDNTLVLQREYLITVFDTGYIKLAPLQIISRRAGKIDTLVTNDLGLNVRGVQVDSVALAPIKYIIREPARLSDYWVLMIVVLAAGAGFVIWNLYRRRSMIPVEIPVPPEPPHRVALGKLKALNEKKLWQQGHIKKYQSELTFIIREYLEGRFHIPALEMTTGEILKRMKIFEKDHYELKNLDEILNIADLVKFARAQPELDIHEEFLLKAEQFILSTVYVESSDKIG